jgi:ElaB/YqjD/DUF883 family membrane-anchored ribosome-binding protein
VNVKNTNKEKKYDLAPDQTGTYFSADVHVKKSLIPAQESGFRGKLVVIKQPQLQKILAARQKLLHPVSEDKAKIIKLLNEIKIKTDELRNKGTIKNRHRSAYQEISKVAEKLQSLLDDAKKQFFDDRKISFDQFKQNCKVAIEAAEPEFKKHRGWYKVDVTLRQLLGFLAMLTMLPGIAVAFVTKQGYFGTFFKTPKTNSEEKLESLKQGLGLHEHI